MDWLFNAAGGRKMLLGLVGIIAVTSLAVTKSITGQEAIEVIQWLVIGVTGALAVSDVGQAIGGGKKK